MTVLSGLQHNTGTLPDKSSDVCQGTRPGVQYLHTRQGRIPQGSDTSYCTQEDHLLQKIDREEICKTAIVLSLKSFSKQQNFELDQIERIHPSQTSN